MRLRIRLRNKLVRALSQSMDVQTMVHVARRIIDDYDIHARSGVPSSLSVPNNDAAKQIVEDMGQFGYLLSFVELLVEIHRNGFVGRKIRIPRLQNIVEELREDGYLFHTASGTFVEDAAQRQTLNWGVLLDGAQYHLGFLAVDVKGNSDMVRRHGTEAMDAVYTALRRLLLRAIEKRNGRLWFWEGDGGVAAFYAGDVGSTAVQSGMELLHELKLYNAVSNPLDTPVELRAAVNTGYLEYDGDFSELQHAPAIKKAQEIEAQHTEANTITVSAPVFHTLDPLLQKCFRITSGNGESAYRSYALQFDGSGVPV